MIVLLIILCVLLTAVIVLSVWGYTLLSKKIDYVYGNQSILYQKILENLQKDVLKQSQIIFGMWVHRVQENIIHSTLFVRRWLMNGMKMCRG